MTHTPAPSRPLRRRLAGSGALLAIVAIGLVGGARPAAATDEFPPNPAAVVTQACTSVGPVAYVALTNVNGADTAYFDITYAGGANHVAVAPNATETVPLSFNENKTDTIHTTEANGFVQDDEVGPFNCTDYQGQIVLSCDGTQPVLTGTYENKGVTDSDVALIVGETGSLAPAGEKQEPLTLEVPDHEPFNATLSSEVEGTFATLSGTPNCDPPPVITTTSTTIADTTSTTSTVPVSVISVNVPNPPAPAAPQVATVTLARTGIATWPLVGAGVTLIGLGVAFRRRAARLA